MVRYRSISQQIYDALPKNVKRNIQLMLSLATSLQRHSKYDVTIKHTIVFRSPAACIQTNKQKYESKSKSKSKENIINIRNINVIQTHTKMSQAPKYTSAK